MNTIKKTAIFVILLMATTGWAQVPYSNDYLDIAQKCYLNSLDSNIDGVRNSTIFMVVQFKYRYPDLNFKDIRKKIEKMSRNDRDIQNRVHSYLALVCLEKPVLMDSINPQEYLDTRQFFDAVFDRISSPQLALNEF